MEHSFNAELASEIGVNAAILLKSIVYWCQKNRASKTNFHDGLYWTYNSAKGYCQLYPYLSARTICNTLGALEKAGYIISACYNTMPFDRTKWYTATPKALEACKDDASANITNRHVDSGESNTPKVSNGSVGFCRPIPDSKPYSKPYTLAQNPSKGQPEALFNRFWAAYPRKVQKVNALKAWAKLKVDDALFETIMDGLRRSKQFDRRFAEPQFTPYPTTWLNAHEWENEYTPPPQPSHTASASSKAIEEIRAIAREVPVPPPRR